MVDWNKPADGDGYTTILGAIRSAFGNLGKMVFTGDSNIPTGFIAWNNSTGQFEKYNGATWDVIVPLALTSKEIHEFFGGEEHTGIIVNAGSETATAHTLGVVPSKVIITRQTGGIIIKGPTADTSTNFYLKNRDISNNATVDVIIFP